jgi:hypothetical protein
MAGNKETRVMTFEHYEVHDGDMYQAWVADDTMADNATINLAFKTPVSTTKQIHMFIDIATKVGCQLEVLEGATWTAKTGTIFVPINANRLSTNTSIITGNETTTAFTANEIAFNVTTILTTNATEIDRIDIYGAQPGRGQQARGETELILKSATKYVIRMTAEGASNMGLIKIRWYEYLPNVV